MSRRATRSVAGVLTRETPWLQPRYHVGVLLGQALSTMCDLWPIRWQLRAGGSEEKSTMRRKVEFGP